MNKGFAFFFEKRQNGLINRIRNFGEKDDGRTALPNFNSLESYWTDSTFRANCSKVKPLLFRSDLIFAPISSTFMK